MNIPLPISTLLAYELGTGYDLGIDKEVGIDKYQLELYRDFYAPQFELVDCYTIAEADDEWQPKCTVVRELATGKLFRTDWKQYCSYSYLPPRCTEEWKEVVKKERLVTYYEEA